MINRIIKKSINETVNFVINTQNFTCKASIYYISGSLDKIIITYNHNEMRGSSQIMFNSLEDFLAFCDLITSVSFSARSGEI